MGTSRQVFVAVTGVCRRNMYVELDHSLEPRMLEDINELTELPGGDKKKKSTKYEAKTGNIQDVFLAFEVNKLDKKEKYEESMNRFGNQTNKKKAEIPEVDLRKCSMMKTLVSSLQSLPATTTTGCLGPAQMTG